MHIVFLSGEYPLWTSGGVGTFIQTFGRSLVREGHLVSVVGPGKASTEIRLEDAGVQIYRLPHNSGKLPNFLFNSIQINKRLKKLQKENPISIIESAEAGLALISKRHPAKKVIRLHGGHHFFAEAEKRGVNWRKGLLEKISFKKADAFIAISDYVKEHTAKYLSYRNRLIEIIHLPLSTAVEIPVVALDLDLILFAGTVCAKKGVRELIEAFKIVHQKYPDKILDIYGREWYYPDGSSYTEMLKQSFEADFFEKVHFHGSIPRDELDIKYTQAAFCVFPSHMETQGLVSLEAMLLKKPVVFSEYGPGPETIVHGETGLLCDVYDPKDIAEKMIWCIENPMDAQVLGENARKVVLEKYDSKAILLKNLSFYEQILRI
jgi:glycosyltransferase involved in cell wall biosynthesis